MRAEEDQRRVAAAEKAKELAARQKRVLKYIEDNLLEYSPEHDKDLKLEEEDCGICQDRLVPLDDEERASDEK